MLEKKSYTLVCHENFYHQRFGEKIITQTKLPIPPLKSQMVSPSVKFQK